MTTTASSSDRAPQLGNLGDHDYAAFRRRVASRFESNLRLSGALFTTDADLWPIYLDSFEPGTQRQHHNCTACRHFIQRYGGLATLNQYGVVSPAIWNPEDSDRTHAISVKNMAEAVKVARITGVFLTPGSLLGTPITEQWAHLALRVPTDHVYVVKLKTAGQAMAEKREDHGQVMRALAEYPSHLLDQVVDLLQTDALYRAEHVLGPAKWLRDLAHDYAKGRTLRSNIVWRAVATAPAGFCHPRSSMVGTLLDDLQSGMPFSVAAERFKAKMHPLQYQRPQVAPSAGNIKRAEDIVAKLGIERSLERRYARIDEVEKLWEHDDARRYAHVEGGAPGMVDRVFAHLKPKGVPPGVPDVRTPTQAVTWAKFLRDVLHHDGMACSIEILVPTRGNFCALLTAVHADAPPILQWDREDQRNPLSWYVYSGGSTADQWGLKRDTWAKVTAVCSQPSEWTDRNSTHHGRSAIFLIENCRDAYHDRTSAGLFPEILKAELREVRATIEAHSKSRHPQGYEQSSACGLRLQNQGSDSVGLRVTSRSGVVSTYKIDRWE